jgi:hypothetical protein
MKNKIEIEIQKIRHGVEQSVGTYMEETTKAELLHLESATAIAIINRTPPARDCDWSMLCPGCKKPVCGHGQSPNAQCYTCDGLVSTLGNLALLHN